MKTTTTTREYDAEGRIVREVVVESDDVRLNACTCAWGSTSVHTRCPIHGYAYRRGWPPGTIICGDTTGSSTFTINGEPASVR